MPEAEMPAPGRPAPQLDLSPAPAPADLGTRVWRQARTEAALSARNGEQALLALVIPLGVLVIARFLGGRFGTDFNAVAASIIALALWSTSFTSLAISTGFERRYGVLERLATTPLTRTGLILGKSVANLLLLAAQLLILIAASLLLGWRPVGAPTDAALAVVALVIAVPGFASWAMALAGTARAEITLGLANLIHVVAMAAGALIIPVAAYPDAMGAVVQFLPTAALGELVRGGFAGVAGVSSALSFAVLVGWSLVGILLARKVFRWMA